MTGLMWVTVLGFSVAYAQIPKEVARALQKAFNDGAKAKLTFHVTDSFGNPVANADVDGGFFLSKGSKQFSGKTDTNGMYTAEGLCSHDMGCQFIKEGYYETKFKHEFTSYDPNVLKDGKWQPWNPTVEITLKEKRNPIPMYAKRVELVLPKTNETFGVDFEAGDLVAPHGKGKVADMTLTYVFSVPPADGGKQEYSAHFSLGSANRYEGVAVMPSDTWSDLRSAYEVQRSPVSVANPTTWSSLKSVHEAQRASYGYQFGTHRRFTMKAKLVGSRKKTESGLVNFMIPTPMKMT